MAGGPDACRDYRKGPGATVVRIEVFDGVVRCREARRVLKNYYPHGRSTPPWSCVDYGDELVQCTRPGGGFRGVLDCPVARPTEIQAPCPGFPSGGDLPARKSCGHFRIAPPGGYPLILVEVVKGKVPCRVARRVLKTQYRNGDPRDIIASARPWRCAGPEFLAVCHKNPGAHHKVIRARFP